MRDEIELMFRVKVDAAVENVRKKDLERAARRICQFMEPEPPPVGHEISAYRSPEGWWELVDKPEWTPVALTLSRLHAVEERLSDQQWEHYGVLMWRHAGSINELIRSIPANRRHLLHASAEEKITAIAWVLRIEAEGLSEVADRG